MAARLNQDLTTRQVFALGTGLEVRTIVHTPLLSYPQEGYLVENAQGLSPDLQTLSEEEPKQFLLKMGGLWIRSEELARRLTA